MFVGTKFKSRTDNSTAGFFEVTWEHFVNRCMKHDIRREKDGPAFSPAAYYEGIEGFQFADWIYFPKEHRRAGEKKGKVWENEKGEKRYTNTKDEITRANANVEAISMAVLDYDGNGTIEDVSAKFEEYNYMLYTTFSHTPETPKFRVVLPLKRPVSVHEFRQVWEGVFRLGGGIADKSTKDPARLHFLPSCPPERAEHRKAFGFTDRKMLSPSKFIRKQAVKKAKPPEKRFRGDYQTLDVVGWFVAHSAYQGPTGKPDQHWVDCPWATEHTGGKQGPTDTCIYTDNKKNWPTFKCSHGHCADRTIKDVIALWGDADAFCEKKLAPKEVRTEVEIKPLGHDDRGYFYYQCNATNNIVALRGNEHRELMFYTITADPDYWYSRYADEDTGKIQWRKVAMNLMGACHAKGFFRPDSIRGGGIWEDDGRKVVHLGRELLVDGSPTPITEIASDHIYEAMVRPIRLPEPITASQGYALMELLGRLPIPSAYERQLFVGHLVCGPLSGILPWRPHIWLTGDADSGKSTILKHVVNPIWGPMGGVYSEGKTTEAGLRQKIRHNAVPVIIDEPESNSRDEVARVANLIALARSSSSDSTANVYKGTTTGTGISFTVRSAFLFCSISHALEWAQDKERFSIIQVKASKGSIDGWPALRKDLFAMLSKEFALGFYSRAISQVEHILESVDTIRRVVGEMHPTSPSRWRDQIGTLTAAAYSLMDDRPMTADFARNVFKQVDSWGGYIEKSETNAPLQALHALVGHLITESGTRRSLGEFILSQATDLLPENFDRLHRYGLDVHGGNLYVSTTHRQTVLIFREYGITGHGGLLSLLPGADTGHVRNFGGVRTKAIRVPLSALE